MISHKKAFGIYHWDTFDNTTILVGEADLLSEATAIVHDKYGLSISPNGADRVDIVDLYGSVISTFTIK